MIQKKRFGRSVGLPSTAQIIRELKIMVRLDAEAPTSPSDPTAPAPAAADPSSLDAR